MFITPAPLHMVANVNSKSSPVRMVIAPHCPHMATKQLINDALHSGHNGLPSLQKKILRFRLSVSIALADLSCYYKRSIINLLGLSMSAIWLQGEEGSSYPFLDPNKSNELELWVFRSPNFGFRDASSLAAAGKNSMGQFYRQFSLESMHKLKPQQIAQAEDYLQRAFSDDVSVTAFLPMIEAEDNSPTFDHPQNWN